ncbi:MAG: CocE/NonD family hydrolase [Thermomicrobiales bacterium]
MTTEAVPVPGVDVQVAYNVPATMRDGVTLYADVYRPAGNGPWPVILMRLPYDKTSAENISYTDPSWYARQGYLVVVQDVRGRCASEGEFTPFQYEAEDGYDTIEWAAHLPGANGKVGMYGFSYAGATQLMPATLRPPSLVTVCPAMTASQYYDGWTYQGGALSLAFIQSWATQLASGDARRAKDAASLGGIDAAFAGIGGWNWMLPLTAYPALGGEYGGYYHVWLAHPTYDDYWRQWSIDTDYSRLTTPALHVAGWYDIFLAGSVRNFLGMQAGAGSEEARANQKLVIGPWVHMPWAPVDDSGAICGPTVVDDLQLRWFDRFLKGAENGVAGAPVSIYVMGAEEWRDYPSWPPPGVEQATWYLHSGGRANSRFGDGALSMDAPGAEPADIFTYDPAYPNPSLGGHSCCFGFVAPMGPADQQAAESGNFVLVYTTPPLAESVELLGEASVILYAATTAVDTDWTARLCQVHPDGRSINLKEGIIRARYRESLSEPSLLEPNRVYEYEIPLGPVGFHIPAGHALRVTISSSDFPQWDRNLNTGAAPFIENLTAAIPARQSVLHNAEHPSRLVVDVLRGG